MIIRSFLLLVSMSLAASAAEVGQVAEISNGELRQLFDANDLPKPWRIVQYNFSDGKKHWVVETYLDPRPLDSAGCKVTLQILEIDRAGGSYRLAGKDPPREMVALSSCERIAEVDHNFASYVSDVPDDELRRAMHALLSLLEGNSALHVEYASSKLVQYLKAVRRNELHWVGTQDNSVAFAFLVDHLFPNLLEIRIRHDGEVLVSETNGPDVYPARR